MNLLEIVNTKEGGYLLGTIGQKPVGKIIHITHNSFIEYLGGDNFQATFFSKRPIEKLFQPIIDKIEIANEYKRIENQREAFLHYADFYHKYNKYPQIFLNSSTFNPAAGANSPVDGRLWNVTNSSWANARASNGNTGDPTEANSTIPFGEKVGGTWNIGRCVFLFDTSSLTSLVTITAAVFSTYAAGTALGKDLTEATYPANLTLVSSNPASNNNLVAADFQSANWGTTKYTDADFAISSYGASDGYKDMTLNATGLAAISKTGITKLGTRPSNDYSDSTAPTARNYVLGYFADNGTNIPKLVVTFTPPATTNYLKFHKRTRFPGSITGI